MKMQMTSTPHSQNQKKLGLWAMISLVFFTVSGGAYGLEALVGTVGAFWSIILIIALPVFWAVPVSMMVAELSTAIPEQGGYYIWVRKALGPFWGFQEGWWKLCYSAVDMALYPVFFVLYLSFFFPHLNEPTPEMQVARAVIALLFIIASLIFNLRGSHLVGINALANLLIVSSPFILVTVLGLFLGDWNMLANAITQPSMGDISPSNLAAGLAIILWNYCGWDNVSTYAEEVENPQRNYPRALAGALLIIVVSYILPLLAGFKVTVTPSDWGETSGWPSIAEKLGGHWLGVFGGAAALLSAWALFNSQVLYVSRLPAAMAKDGWLPSFLAKVSPKYNAPVAALVSISMISAVFATFSLKKLMVVDILFYTLGLSLQFAALIALRITKPEMKRPYKIKLPIWGLVLLAAPPLILALLVATFSMMGDSGGFIQVGIVAAGVGVGLVVYFVRRAKASARISMHLSPLREDHN